MGRCNGFLVLATVLLGLAIVPAEAATLAVDHGNIVLDGKSLTSSGNDSDPLLSPDGKTVVFVRLGDDSDAMAKCSSDGALPVRGIALWSVKSDGTGAAKLLDAHPGDRPETTLCEFGAKGFDSTGRLLYVDTPAWATSSAVHVLDLRAKKERFFVAGSLIRVVSACADKKYLNTVVAEQHRYFVLGGSYDWPYLFSPAGKELGPVSDDTSKLGGLDDACDTGSAAPPTPQK